MIRASLLASVLLFGCANNGANGGTPGSSPAPVAQVAAQPLDPAEPPLPFLAVCRESCAQRNAQRAVGAQMIDAQCTGECVEGWRLPAVRTKVDLMKLLGARAKVFGRLTEAARLTLSDGTIVSVVAGPNVDAAAGPTEIVVVGSISAGAITDATIIAPSGP